MAFYGAQYPITTAAVTITAALGLSAPIRPIHLSIQNLDGNTTLAYLGKSNVTNAPANAFHQLSVGETFTYAPGDGSRHLNTSEIFIVGTVATNPILILAVE